MPRSVFGILGRVVVVLALMLGGLSPAWSGAATSHSPAAMTMTHGMPMHHEMATKKSPVKHMPCCGEDGCCIAGPCAAALLLSPAGWIERAEFASEIAFANAAGPGTSFPPSFRPPIPRRAFS